MREEGESSSREDQLDNPYKRKRSSQRTISMDNSSVEQDSDNGGNNMSSGTLPERMGNLVNQKEI
jgi:hypothetical protein